MSKLYSSLFFILILSSCGSEENTKYYWVDFRSSINPIADTIEINRINTFQKADTFKLSYYSPVDTIHYTFLKSQGNPAAKVDFFGYQGLIRPLKDTTIVIGREDFQVTTYIVNELAMDGRTIHYYSPKIGVFAIHSIVFFRVWYLQTNNKAINHKINKLIKLTVPERFTRGSLPKAIAD